MNYTLADLIEENIRYVALGFENCEGLQIPIENFEYLDINNNEVNCEINLSNNIVYGGFYKISPLERINKFNDIVHFELLDKNKNIRKIDIPWYDPEPGNPFVNSDNNEYQKTELVQWNKLKLSIKKDNKKFTLKEILKMNKEMIIKDTKENTYNIKQNKEGTYIDTFVTFDLLETEFTISK